MNNTMNFNLKNQKNKLKKKEKNSKYADDKSERSKMCNTARENFGILHEKSK